MDVLLKPELERFVAEKVKAGQFSNISDVVNEALQALKEQEEFTHEDEAPVRNEVLRAIEELDQGKHSDFTAETIIQTERSKLEGRGEKA